MSVQLSSLLLAAVAIGTPLLAGVAYDVLPSDAWDAQPFVRKQDQATRSIRYVNWSVGNTTFYTLKAQDDVVVFGEAACADCYPRLEMRLDDAEDYPAGRTYTIISAVGPAGASVASVEFYLPTYDPAVQQAYTLGRSGISIMYDGAGWLVMGRHGS